MPEVLEDFSLSKSIQNKGTLQKIGVIGCGTMGEEITRVVSQSGIDVIFLEINQGKVEEALKSISCHLDKMINKWGLTASEKKLILSRIKGTTSYSDLKDCDIVIETIDSKKKGTSIEIRKEIFQKLEEEVKENTVITSNTSTLTISDLASVLKHPERAVGLHFLAPASKVKIVEVVKGVQTCDEAYEMVNKFARMIGKKVININESPGNISTRLIVTLINEACEILMEGVGSVEAIDETMKLGFGLQFGPLEMADRIGLDKLLKWMDNLYAEFGEKQFKASPIIKRLVRANQVGRRVGKGFYNYEGGKAIGQTVTCTEFN
ncbi:MAG: 3-hydroxyacyl-CoA dehydrogenase NAD-binding domain-containing protein [Lentimicrobiaceae bacterium]|nr:3-hydroxyacyl-CoA dehydrogenase NAD-binding domain-containing protein [Lentimicrobiaceae bacterium]